MSPQTAASHDDGTRLGEPLTGVFPVVSRPLPGEPGGPRAGASGSGGPVRRGRPGYDRATLMAVCVDVFNRHGYDATSMGMLAKHLGISKSAIYHHVDSKEAILEQALDDALGALEAAFDEVEAGEGGTGERVEAAVRATLQALADHMPQVTLLLRLRGNSDVELRAMERRRAVTRRLGALLEAGQAEGTVRDDITPRNLARLTLGMINSIVDWFRPDGPHTVEDMVRSVAGVVLTGVRG